MKNIFHEAFAPPRGMVQAMKQFGGLLVPGKGFAARVLAICLAALLAYGVPGAASPDFEAAAMGKGHEVEVAVDRQEAPAIGKERVASAMAKKYQVTVTIKMGKEGSSCPELRFEKNGKEYLAQAVSQWYIDGKRDKKPWSRFFGDGWKFKDHKVTVVMSTKLANGTYKVTVDNGSKARSLGDVTIDSKAVKKTFKFA
jgi:hypothetical protein